MNDLEQLKEQVEKLAKTKKQKSVRIRCVYLSKEGDRQLNALMEKWGENPSAILRHCLSLVYNQEFPNKLSL